jgi:uncharacterized membrane-anchored protein
MSSLSMIEMAIKEANRDGEISQEEFNSIIALGESMGVSSNVINDMIKAELEKYVKAQEAQTALVEKNKATKLAEEQKERQKEQEKTYYDNWYNWDDDSPNEGMLVLYGLIGLVVGIVNAYTHDKSWYSYILMPILTTLYGLACYGIVYGLSNLQRRKPLLDWKKPILIPFAIVLVLVIAYLILPI